MKDSTFKVIQVSLATILCFTYIFVNNKLLLGFAAFFMIWFIIDIIFPGKKSDSQKPLSEK